MDVQGVQVAIILEKPLSKVFSYSIIYGFSSAENNMSLNDGFTLGGKFQCICFRQMLDFM
jgi:hypothetical protein